MDRPSVLIIEPNAFHRRLMSDLVECNDMKATAVAAAPDDADAGDATIVVIDLDAAKKEDVRFVERLNALPRRPRIVGVAAGGVPASFKVEEVIHWPIDTGAFARAIARQAMEARRADGI